MDKSSKEHLKNYTFGVPLAEDELFHITHFSTGQTKVDQSLGLLILKDFHCLIKVSLSIYKQRRVVNYDIFMEEAVPVQIKEKLSELRGNLEYASSIPDVTNPSTSATNVFRFNFKHSKIENQQICYDFCQDYNDYKMVDIKFRSQFDSLVSNLQDWFREIYNKVSGVLKTQEISENFISFEVEQSIESLEKYS